MSHNSFAHILVLIICWQLYRLLLLLILISNHCAYIPVYVYDDGKQEPTSGGHVDGALPVMK